MEPQTAAMCKDSSSGKKLHRVKRKRTEREKGKRVAFQKAGPSGESGRNQWGLKKRVGGAWE